MDGWWDANDLVKFFDKLYASRAIVEVKSKEYRTLAAAVYAKIVPEGSVKRSHEVADAHYSIDNDLFQRMLDPRMAYSCGVWCYGAKDLTEAQEDKLELICRKLRLKPGMTVLEIGCGWGSFAKYASEKYGVHVTGITVSDAQAELAREVCKGLPVKIEQVDYRKISGQYDRVVSIAMFEAVGKRYINAFFDAMSRYLKEDGIFFLHTIGFFDKEFTVSPWLDKYIFPGSYVPYFDEMGKALQDRFVVEHYENIGAGYAPTLHAWYDNFVAAWPEIKGRYDERFYRMWVYYLNYCEATFHHRFSHVWHFVMRKKSAKGAYSFEPLQHR
ncbi:MAG: cyclopropane fatty acyl phospholipid synthase, partial [Caulobacteraceae bacterium]|nr:cyclopropane fatty acyl phospholipid synthase [Caulobacteraceae bacterium]